MFLYPHLQRNVKVLLVWTLFEYEAHPRIDRGGNFAASLRHSDFLSAEACHHRQRVLDTQHPCLHKLVLLQSQVKLGYITIEFSDRKKWLDGLDLLPWCPRRLRHWLVIPSTVRQAVFALSLVPLPDSWMHSVGWLWLKALPTAKF